jgi:hypothetical protein
LFAGGGFNQSNKRILEETTLATKNTSTNEVRIFIPPIRLETVVVRVKGDTSLLMNRWTERAIKSIEGKQTRQAKGGRDARDPQKEFQESIYRTVDGEPGFPATAFKRAMVDACRTIQGLAMTEVRVIVHVLGEILPIVEPSQPKFRRDMTRLKNGTWTPVYRAEVDQWAFDLPIRFNAEMLSQQQVANLVQHAGLGGVGPYRPGAPEGKSGNHGMFRVVTELDLAKA